MADRIKHFCSFGAILSLFYYWMPANHPASQGSIRSLILCHMMPSKYTFLQWSAHLWSVWHPKPCLWSNRGHRERERSVHNADREKWGAGGGGLRKWGVTAKGFSYAGRKYKVSRDGENGGVSPSRELADADSWEGLGAEKRCNADKG